MWVNESALYRTSKWIDDKENELLKAGKPFNESLLGAAEEYAIECAILKVSGSEMLDFVVDEGLQVHGGNGYSDEYVISKAYRDSRINRIYEGTNEINRLLTVDMVLKRAMKGKLDLMGPAMAVQKELMSIPDFRSDDETPFAKERKLIANFKKAILMTAGAAVQKLMMKIENEQEILMNIARYVHRNLQCRERIASRDEAHRAERRSCGSVRTAISCIPTSMMQQTASTKQVRMPSTHFAEGDEQRMMLLGLKRFTKADPFDSKEARRGLQRS